MRHEWSAVGTLGALTPTISVVIPTLNEADALPRTVRTLRDAATRSCEIVVSDCGSADNTQCVARAHGARVVGGGRCRGDAMNRGAAVAIGDVLLFLHADTRLLPAFDASIARAIANGCVGGAFDFSFGADDRARGIDKQKLKVVKILNRIRFRWHRTFYGDQAIFCRRDAFEQIGGFDAKPLFEDARFSRRMGRVGRTAILQPPVKTSPRRFVERGILRQLTMDLLLMGLDNCGVEPAPLWRHYNQLNRDGHAEAPSPRE